MKRGFFVGLFLAASALPAVGCGDDDDGDDDGGTGGTGGGMNVECTPGGGGACQNDTDCPKVESGEARTDSQTCGRSCLEEPEEEQAMCTVGCIVQEAAITQACAVCYATLAGCAADNCLAECGSAPASDACNQCQIDEGCRGAFDTCSGLTTVPP